MMLRRWVAKGEKGCEICGNGKVEREVKRGKGKLIRNVIDIGDSEVK